MTDPAKEEKLSVSKLMLRLLLVPLIIEFALIALIMSIVNQVTVETGNQNRIELVLEQTLNFVQNSEVISASVAESVAKKQKVQATNLKGTIARLENQLKEAKASDLPSNAAAFKPMEDAFASLSKAYLAVAAATPKEAKKAVTTVALAQEKLSEAHHKFRQDNNQEEIRSIGRQDQAQSLISFLVICGTAILIGVVAFTVTSVRKSMKAAPPASSDN